MTRVAPGLFSDNNLNKCFRVIKLFGRDGAKVRESITPSITVGDDFFTRLGMPKGDRCCAKSQGNPHPRGVIRGRDIDYLRVFKRKTVFRAWGGPAAQSAGTFAPSESRFCQTLALSSRESAAISIVFCAEPYVAPAA